LELKFTLSSRKEGILDDFNITQTYGSYIEGDIDREYNLSILDGDKDLGILGNWKEFVRFLY
jgi:hypothetical protein